MTHFVTGLGGRCNECSGAVLNGFVQIMTTYSARRFQWYLGKDDGRYPRENVIGNANLIDHELSVIVAGKVFARTRTSSSVGVRSQ